MAEQYIRLLDVKIIGSVPRSSRVIILLASSCWGQGGGRARRAAGSSLGCSWRRCYLAAGRTHVSERRLATSPLSAWWASISGSAWGLQWGIFFILLWAVMVCKFPDFDNKQPVLSVT